MFLQFVPEKVSNTYYHTVKIKLKEEKPEKERGVGETSM